MNSSVMFGSGASSGASMSAQLTTSTDLKHVRAALSGIPDVAINGNIGRTSVIYVPGSTVGKSVRETCIEGIVSSLNSIFRREKIFHNEQEALDFLEGILSKSIDFHVISTNTTITNDQYKGMIATVKLELDNMSDKQAFFALIVRFVFQVSNCTGVPVPAVLLASKQNATSTSTAGPTQTTIRPLSSGLVWNNASTINTVTHTEPDEMDTEPDSSPEVQSNPAPGPSSLFSGAVFTFPLGASAQQSLPRAQEKLSPRQGSYSYLGGISLDLRWQGLGVLHGEVLRMHHHLSPFQGMLLDQDGLYELTHGLDAKILNSIHSEAQLYSRSLSDPWLDQKYKEGVQRELAALVDESAFLENVKELLNIRDVEMTDTSPYDSCAEPMLTQEEVDALSPLSGPPSLQSFSVDKRKRFLFCMLRKAKRMNEKATSAFKERLQPSEMMHMVHQEELTIVQRIDSAMQNQPSRPSDVAIEREYDSQSEHELQDCSRLDSFVNKVKGYHRRFKHIIFKTKGRIASAFGLSGSSGASHAADTQQACPPNPPVEDIKASFISALSDAINSMNVSVSNSHNEGRTILQPAQVAELASQLEVRMTNDLGQQHIGTLLTQQQQKQLYIQAGHNYLQRIMDGAALLRRCKFILG